MLCQSIMGVSDDIIINDYYQSHFNNNSHHNQSQQQQQQSQKTSITEGSMAMQRLEESLENENDDAKINNGNFTQAKTQHHQDHQQQKKTQQWNPNMMYGAPREIMKQTLVWIRQEYNGSVCPNYLITIGFDKQWQIRFRNAIFEKTNQESI